MHCANNAVIMQTKQLGQIETLKEKLHALEGCNQDLEHKLLEQDHIIANLVGDNLKHLQDNMHLTTHINSLLKHMMQLEHWLGQVGSVLMGMIEGVIEREGSSLEAGMLGASGNNQDDQGGDRDNGSTGASLEGSTKVESLMPWEGGLIMEMEREAIEAGAGGWYNGSQDVPESWSGCNSITSASQDQVGTTLLTTCHWTLFLLVFSIHFRPNFTSHSLPNLSPLCLSLIYSALYAFTLTTNNKNTIRLVLLVIEQLIYWTINIPKQSCCGSSSPGSCTGTSSAATKHSHHSKFQTSRTRSMSRSASTARRLLVIKRFLTTTAARSPRPTASI